MKVTEELFNLRDSEYAAFQAKLTPTIAPEKFIGVRLPILRKFAKEYAKDPECSQFMSTLPHDYYDENLLHSVLITYIKDYDTCMQELEKFLPYIDNWAVCDTMSPKVLRKNKEALLLKIKEWVKSDKTYTIRFGVDMLMSFYLDDDFKPEYLEIPASIRSDEYYVNMMTAWYFATALAKQWDEAVKYIENRRLDRWTHNKAIQKSIESFRVTQEHKDYLRSLKY
ncbi:MAG: DNA alkylation repair protein [Clostridia bacterium]|nr:DNA alkylation repair protein [Clostridia bacterium]